MYTHIHRLTHTYRHRCSHTHTHAHVGTHAVCTNTPHYTHTYTHTQAIINSPTTGSSGGRPAKAFSKLLLSPSSVVLALAFSSWHSWIVFGKAPARECMHLSAAYLYECYSPLAHSVTQPLLIQSLAHMGATLLLVSLLGQERYCGTSSFFPDHPTKKAKVVSIEQVSFSFVRGSPRLFTTWRLM